VIRNGSFFHYPALRAPLLEEGEFLATVKHKDCNSGFCTTFMKPIPYDNYAVFTYFSVFLLFLQQKTPLTIIT